MTAAAEGSRAIRVLVADDHAMLREGLRWMMQGEADLEWVGEAADGTETVRLVRERRPDVVVLDVAMPDVSGLEALRQLAADGALPRVLLLTGEIAEDDLAEALALGARGYISKEAATQQLFKAIRALAAGEYWLGRDVVSRLLDHARGEFAGGRQAPSSPLEPLTPREREIVAAMAAGESNRAVAERLQMAEQTVKHHLTHVFEKLGVSSRGELIAWLGRRAAKPIEATQNGRTRHS
jgi:DNA-binding NarL/FixJ family response regulator